MAASIGPGVRIASRAAEPWATSTSSPSPAPTVSTATNGSPASAPAASAGRTIMSDTARRDSVLTVATAWPITRQTIIGVSYGRGRAGLHAARATLARVSWPAGTLVLPSILSADFGAFRSQVVELLDAGARAFHVDVMDGHFVPVITFGPHVVSSFADLVHERGGTIDVHLMIEQPERQLAEFARAGADSCTVHVETCPHLHHTLGADPRARHDRRRDAQPGDAHRGAARGRPRGRLLLCMSVNPGWGGQKFIEASIDRLAELQAMLRPGMGLEVDGGVARRRSRAATRPARTCSWRAPRSTGSRRPARPGRRSTALVADA